MSTEQNKILIHEFIDAFLNHGNVERFREIVALDYVEHEELPPGTPQGRDGVETIASTLRSGLPDFKATIEDMIAEDDKVMIRMTWSGTQTGEFMGFPPSGKPVSFSIIDIFRVSEGQIREHWGILDTMGMMQQLGAMPG